MILRHKFLWIISIAYCAAHVLLILNPGTFWDDWIFSANTEEVRSLFQDLSLPLFSPFFVWVADADLIFIPRLITFISIYFSAILLYLIVKKETKSEHFAFWSALFFAVAPYDILGRSVLCTVHYHFCLLCFLLGLYLARSNRIQNFFFSLPILFVSFITPSFVPSFLYVFTALILFNDKEVNKKTRIYKMVFGWALVMIFWKWRSIVWHPTGEYSNYNVINPSYYLSHFKELLDDTVFNTLQPLIVNYGFSDVKRVASQVSILLISVIAWKIWKQKKIGRDLGILIFSMIFLHVSLFSYQVVEKMPSLTDWESRHQLILLLAAPLFFAALIQFIFSSARWIRGISIFVFLSFFSVTLFLYSGLLGLYFQQQGMETQMRKLDSQFPNEFQFVLEDNRQKFSLIDVTFRFYELVGMYNEVTLKRDRILLSGQELDQKDTPYWKDLILGTSKNRYLMNDLKLPLDPKTKISVTSRPLERFEIVELLMKRTFLKEAYQHKIDDLVQFRFSSLK